VKYIKELKIEPKIFFTVMNQGIIINELEVGRYTSDSFDLFSLKNLIIKNKISNFSYYLISDKRLTEKEKEQLEQIIFTNLSYSLRYSTYGTKKRLPKEVEDKILDDPLNYEAVDYISKILKKRWPEFEKKLLDLKKQIRELGQLDDPEEDDLGEQQQIESTIFEYTRSVIKGRWPESEF
jgi:hypothetical protein